MGLGLSCGCYELNCTAEMVEFEFIFDESPTDIHVTPPADNETTPTSEFNKYIPYTNTIIL